jgi:hypothetical protein
VLLQSGRGARITAPCFSRHFFAAHTSPVICCPQQHDLHIWHPREYGGDMLLKLQQQGMWR